LFEKIKSESGLKGGIGHKFYEEWRKLNPAIPSQFERMEELNALSVDYYDKLRRIIL